MTAAASPEETTSRAEMAAAVQRLGHALMGHRPTIDLARKVADAANELADLAELLPTRDRLSELTAGHNPLEDPRLPQAVDVDPDEAGSTLSAIEGLGVDLNEVTSLLEAEGVTAFTKSFDELLGVLDGRAAQLRS